MSESDFKMLTAEFERLQRECDTPEKALAQLQFEGLLDADGEVPSLYCKTADELVWQ